MDNKTGFLIRPKNEMALVDKIEYLLDHPDEENTMGHAGKSRLKQEFNLKKMTNKHLELYQDCLKG